MIFPKRGYVKFASLWGSLFFPFQNIHQNLKVEVQEFEGCPKCWDKPWDFGMSLIFPLIATVVMCSTFSDKPTPNMQQFHWVLQSELSWLDLQFGMVCWRIPCLCDVSLWWNTTATVSGIKGCCPWSSTSGRDTQANEQCVHCRSAINFPLWGMPKIDRHYQQDLEMCLWVDDSPRWISTRYCPPLYVYIQIMLYVLI